jgi:hypothetical protein
MNRKNLLLKFLLLSFLFGIFSIMSMNAQDPIPVDSTNVFSPPLTDVHLVYVEAVYHDGDADGVFNTGFCLSAIELGTAFSNYSMSAAFYASGLMARNGTVGFVKTNDIIPVPGEVMKLWFSFSVGEKLYTVYAQSESMEEPLPIYDGKLPFRNSDVTEINRWTAFHWDEWDDYLTIDSIALITNSDPTLKSLSTSIGTLDPPFTPEEVDYEVWVPYGTTSLQVTAVPNGMGAEVNYYDGVGNPIPGGLATFTADGLDVEVAVKALDGTELSYIIAIFVEPGVGDATLSDIELSVSALDPAFHRDSLEYTVIVPEGTTTVDVNGVLTYSEATLTGDGTLTLSGGTSSTDLVVTSYDQTATRTYTVNIQEADGKNYSIYLPGGNGKNSNIDISGLPLSSLPYTIEMWLKPEGTQAWNAGLLYNRGETNHGGVAYASSWQGANLIRFMTIPSGEYGTVTGNVVTDVWHHLAVVLTDSFRTVYLDGVQYQTKIGSPALDYSDGKTYIGWDNGLDSRSFKGWIDEIRIWNDSLSADTLNANKYEVLKGDEANLLAYWNFDLTNSSTAIDLSTTEKHGTITGGTYGPSFPRVNLELSSLTVSGHRMKPAFSPLLTEYYITLPIGATSVDIGATATVPENMVSGTGVVPITEPRGTLTVTVTSTEEQESQDYLIHYVVETELTLKNSYTFADGTAQDHIGGAHGDVRGGSITEGVFSSEVEGDYIVLPGGELALNKFPSITLEAYVTTGVNDGYSMLAYFGGLQSANSLWMQISRPDDLSRTELNTSGAMTNAIGLEPGPGENHHYVTVATHDSLYWYIDGVCVDTAATLENTIIAKIDTSNGWLCYGGWNDPTWIGSLYEFNIYSGIMDPQTVAARSINFPVDDETSNATLSTVLVGGDTLQEFASYRLEYDINLETGVSDVPGLAATPSNANATVDITDAAELPGTSTILVTAEDETTQVTYKFNFIPAPSNVATLSDLAIGGVTIDGFDPETFVYYLELPAGTTTVPPAGATPTNENASVVINDAATLPGNTTVEVTAEDGETKNTYTVVLSVAVGVAQANAPGISVYPSISRELFMVRTPGGESTITVYDLTGSLVSKLKSQESETMLRTPRPGLYIVKVENKSGIGVFRIIHAK